MKKPLLIVKTGTTVQGLIEHRGDFETWIAECIAATGNDIQLVNVYQGEILPAVSEVGAVIITGSPAMVTDREPWSEQAAAWLLTAVESAMPVLGICYGHQLLAHALGGVVDYHPRGREIGTVEICLTGSARQDPLFGTEEICFPVHVSHSQTVIQLPENSVVLAENQFEPHHAVRFSENCWGVQYHPEFDEEIMRAYINTRSEALKKEGHSPEELLQKVEATPEATMILPRFMQLAGSL